MKKITDFQKALEIIERLDTAKIGEHKKWKLIIRKIKNNMPLSMQELEYYTNITRIYKIPQSTENLEYTIQNYLKMTTSHHVLHVAANHSIIVI